MVSSLVESAIHSLGDSQLPIANWVFKLLDVSGGLDEARGLDKGNFNWY